MNLQELSSFELERVFTDGICPEPQNLIGSWKGIFLPFIERAPLPFKNLLTFAVSKTWGNIWKGKEIFIDQKTNKIKGLNIIYPSLKTLSFDVKKVRSRVDSGDAVEFDYSSHIHPFGFIRDEVRLVKGSEKQKLIGIMFLESSFWRFPIIFFGLERL